MSNVFAGAQVIDRRYDLKGSTHGRKASAKELKKSAPILKDIDWLEREKPMVIGTEERNLLATALQEDTRFLRSQGLIDYSLLMGIAKGIAQDQTAEVDDPSGRLATPWRSFTSAGAVYDNNNVVKVTDG